ncbi:MAG: ATP-binding protein [Acidimicrobiia bacterium]|nr:ATP-binding protein [Acidimicrobiia bacterium]
MTPTPSAASEYWARVDDELLARRLRSASAVLIEGPRACGKTTTARQQASSEVLLDRTIAAMSAPSLDSLAILDGPTPRLVDEWQFVPDIWGMVRRETDRRGTPGQFILTGSADPPADLKQHSGVGRVARLRMRPMSLFESGLSDGAVSLRALFDGEPCSAPAPAADLGDVAEAVCRGGWPLCRNMSADDAQDFVTDYLDELAGGEVGSVDGTRRDPAGVARLLGSLARNISSEATLSTLAADSGGERPSDPRTVSGYLAALERLFVVEDVPAWAPRLRSRSRLRGASKRQLADPSLAAAALGADRRHLLADLETFGLLFESLCVRDLRILSRPLRATVSHYRDNTGLEVDTVIRRRNGDWVAVEIKLGGRAGVDAAAAALLRLRDRVDTEHVGEPKRLIVLTATGFAYERTDGVTVTPISCLGP